MFRLMRLHQSAHSHRNQQKRLKSISSVCLSRNMRCLSILGLCIIVMSTIASVESRPPHHRPGFKFHRFPHHPPPFQPIPWPPKPPLIVAPVLTDVYGGSGGLGTTSGDLLSSLLSEDSSSYSLPNVITLNGSPTSADYGSSNVKNLLSLLSGSRSNYGSQKISTSDTSIVAKLLSQLSNPNGPVLEKIEHQPSHIIISKDSSGGSTSNGNTSPCSSVLPASNTPFQQGRSGFPDVGSSMPMQTPTMAMPSTVPSFTTPSALPMSMLSLMPRATPVASLSNSLPITTTTTQTTHLHHVAGLGSGYGYGTDLGASSYGLFGGGASLLSPVSSTTLPMATTTVTTALPTTRSFGITTPSFSMPMVSMPSTSSLVSPFGSGTNSFGSSMNQFPASGRSVGLPSNGNTGGFSSFPSTSQSFNTDGSTGSSSSTGSGTSTGTTTVKSIPKTVFTFSMPKKNAALKYKLLQPMYGYY